MKASKNLPLAAFVGLALTAGAALSLPVRAQTMDHSKMPSTGIAAELTDGEVKKVDKDTKKITIKHGEIKNLEMPGMTMVFQVKDPAWLDQVKAGDKVRFKADKINGAIVVTEIQPAGK
ncbi:copper-binding protein [Roseateles puraquae]|jgi:Cu(I)/Ag(I) efflux system periplasmic protein CusF|uniref:Copper-binding protein n=1 Tax=Roseateles puraquae TaxID=431059 RepID=A0A254MYA4_9BURK|nr:copper-binding protein [Roseateles puraquae]MDG0855817.1 copper-binding protein [Roseateles puraquae]OWQ99934.1 copper-binding protein [Roseateles puraquae]